MNIDSFLKTVRYVLEADKLSNEEVKTIFEKIKEKEIKYFSLERMLNKEMNYHFDEYLYFC